MEILIKEPNIQSFIHSKIKYHDVLGSVLITWDFDEALKLGPKSTRNLGESNILDHNLPKGVSLFLFQNYVLRGEKNIS